MSNPPDARPAARAAAEAYRELEDFIKDGNFRPALRRRYEWALTELAFAADCLAKAAKELQTDPPQPTA